MHLQHKDESEIKFPWSINGEKMTREEFIKRTQVKRMTMKQLNDLLGFKVEIIE